MTRPRARSGLLCGRGRRLFYKPVGDVGRSCLRRRLVTPPPAVGPEACFGRTGMPVRQILAFDEATALLSGGEPAAGIYVAVWAGRMAVAGQSVATRHGDAFVWRQGCRHDIAFPLESALGQVNTEQTARNPRHRRLLRKSYSGGQTNCVRVGESILHCVKSDWRVKAGGGWCHPTPTAAEALGTERIAGWKRSRERPLGRADSRL